MRIRLLRGRTFTADDRRGAPLVMVINETLAREAFPGQDPIGKRIACCEAGPDGAPNWKEVVGVVNDVRAEGLQRGAGARVLPADGAGAGRRLDTGPTAR